MGTNEAWFPTMVYHEFADQETKESIDAEYRQHEAKIIEALTPFTWEDNIDTTFQTADLIERYALKTLYDFIMKSAKEYVGSEKLELYESWANYSKRNSFQNVHHHDLKGISGTYYIQTNGEDGDFVLRHLMPTINPDRVNFKPQVGKLLLFPGWAPHSVSLNKTDSVRISISCNIRYL